ncbi:glycosyltransferase family 4 protein [Segetibacter aerophilus]|uniref:Glycosyl transferase n=1 Tax=Segetibacter aerophilus TaxID=670293 RepID=A0A512BGZ6_9BACT|nr:glycosyltransferase family 4 protein [Segetibacter aerophilus]GEO11241.1 glycosyl transferase [Segetibacter aerophilus]
MRSNKNTTLRRLLFVGQFPPPIHGVSVLNNYLLQSKIIRAEFTIDFIDLKFGRTIKELEKFSIKKLIIAVRYIFVIIYKTCMVRYSIVYFTLTPTGFGFYRDALYVLIMKFFSSKIVLHLHGKGIQNNIDNIIKRKLYRHVLKDTSIICLSERLIFDLDNVYFGKPFIVPNGIEIQKDAGLKKTALIQGIPRILFVSNFIKNKGVLVLLDALTILKDRGYDFEARFVGAPSNITIEMLENEIEERGMKGHVTVVGPLYSELKFKEFKNADIFVFPTYNDAFGLVNLEAMQYGLPVISTFEGSIPDVVINEVTGYLVEKEDISMLAEKIEILIKDEALRLEMGSKGYERCRGHFALENFEANMERTFKMILSNKAI